MPERTEGKAVERSCRLYERLLKFYPKAHREEYGGPMSQLFRDQCRDAWAERRAWGLISFWLRTVVDLLKTALLEHLSNLTSRESMINLFRPQFGPVSVFLPVFAVVFLAVLLTSIAFTFLTPQRFFSVARIMLVPVQTDSRLGPASSYDASALKTEFEVIQSHAVLSKVVAASDLCEVWGKKYNRGTPLKDSDAEAILMHNIELQPIRNTMMIEIRAFSDSPSEVRGLLEGLIEAYREYHAEQLQQGDTNVTWTRVMVIQDASPALKLGPNEPLNITLGVMAGVLLGLLAGGIGAGLAARGRQNSIPTGGAQTISSVPSDSPSSTREKPGISLGVWLVGSLWVSIAIPLTAVILISLSVVLFSTGLTGQPAKPASAEVVFLLVFGFGGALFSVGSFALLRGKTWARVYVAVGAAALAVWSALASSFPFPGPFKGVFIVLGLVTIYTLLPGLRPEKLLARVAQH